jgi:hypothetical protein
VSDVVALLHNNALGRKAEIIKAKRQFSKTFLFFDH